MRLEEVELFQCNYCEEGGEILEDGDMKGEELALLTSNHLLLEHHHGAAGDLVLVLVVSLSLLVQVGVGPL